MIPDLATLRDLLARTQAATGPDPRLAPDINVAFFANVDEIRSATGRSRIPDFTSSLDDALALVAHLLPEWSYKAIKEGFSSFFVLSEPPANSWAPQRQHAGGGPTTMPVAACGALLAALIARTEREQRAAALSDLAASDAKMLP